MACVGLVLCLSPRISTFFKDMEEMLLRLYFLYEKSPKTCELGEIVEELEEGFEFPKGGNKPVRSQRSRWINHKRKALQRVVDRYGAYHQSSDHTRRRQGMAISRSGCSTEPFLVVRCM